MFPDADMEYIYLGKEDKNNEDDKIISDVTNRFIRTYKEMGLTGYRMGKDCSSITKQKISNIEKGVTEVTADILADFALAYENVNANYILTGKGDMFLNNESSATNSDTEPKFSTTSAMYETLIKDRDEQIEELKAEVNKLIGENNIMREQLGMKERKISSKSA